MRVALIGADKASNFIEVLDGSSYYVSEIVSGDHDPSFAKQYAKSRGIRCSWIDPAERSTYGQRIAKVAEALVVAWDGADPLIGFVVALARTKGRLVYTRTI